MKPEEMRLRAGSPITDGTVKLFYPIHFYISVTPAVLLTSPRAAFYDRTIAVRTIAPYLTPFYNRTITVSSRLRTPMATRIKFVFSVPRLVSRRCHNILLLLIVLTVMVLS